MANCAASIYAHAKYGLPFLTLPVPLRLPLLIFVLSTQRQYEAEFPTVGKRLIAPVSSVIVWAKIVPIPCTVSNCSYDGVCCRRLWTVFSSVLICCCRQSNTTRLLVTASTWVSSVSRVVSSCFVSSCIRLPLKRAPVLRAMMFCTLRTFAVC